MAKRKETIRTWQYNAEEYSDIKKGDGWVFARLVACSVAKGTGQGARQPRENLREVEKVSAREFGRVAHTSDNTVRAYLELWQAAYEDPNVPEVWIDPDKLEPWQATDTEVELPKIDFKVFRADRKAVMITSPAEQVVELPAGPIVKPSQPAPNKIKEEVRPELPPTTLQLVPVQPECEKPAPRKKIVLEWVDEWMTSTEQLLDRLSDSEVDIFIRQLEKVLETVKGALREDQS